MAKAKPEDVDAYIAAASSEARPKLEELRALITATMPKAEEKIWYGVPFYDYCGELAGFSVHKRHVSFGFGADVLQSDDRKLLEEQGYKAGKGTLQIKFDQQLPRAVIRRILKDKARINRAAQAAGSK